jgi:hypothetical protein
MLIPTFRSNILQQSLKLNHHRKNLNTHSITSMERQHYALKSVDWSSIFLQNVDIGYRTTMSQTRKQSDQSPPWNTRNPRRVTVIYVLPFSFSESQMDKEMNLKRRDTMDLEVKCSASRLESAVPSPCWNICCMIKLTWILLCVS